MTAEEIKSIVSIENVLNRIYGLDVKARSPCPIHGGEHNNFSISDDFYNCFTCGASGDVFNLVQELSNTDFKGAMGLICEAFGLDVGNKSKEEKQALKIKIELHKERQEAKQTLRKLRNYQQDRIRQLLRAVQTAEGNTHLEKHLIGLLRRFDARPCFFIVHDIHAHLNALWDKYKTNFMKGVIETMKIIVDTREQAPYQFTKAQYSTATTEQGTLSTGDYSLTGLEHLIAIERKSLDDLASTLSAGRERFTKECERGRGLEYFGLVVEASLEDIKAHNYKSKMTPHSLLQSLASFSVKYGLHVHYCGSRDGGEYMTYSLLEKFLIAKQRQLESILKHEAGAKIKDSLESVEANHE